MASGLPCSANDDQDGIMMITDLINGGNVVLCTEHLVDYCDQVVRSYVAAQPQSPEPVSVVSSGGDTDTDDEDAHDPVTSPDTAPEHADSAGPSPVEFASAADTDN